MTFMNFTQPISHFLLNRETNIGPTSVCTAIQRLPNDPENGLKNPVAC